MRTSTTWTFRVKEDLYQDHSCTRLSFIPPTFSTIDIEHPIESSGQRCEAKILRRPCLLAGRSFTPSEGERRHQVQHSHLTEPPAATALPALLVSSSFRLSLLSQCSRSLSYSSLILLFEGLLVTHNFNLSSVSSTNQEYRIHGFWNEADFFFWLICSGSLSNMLNFPSVIPAGWLEELTHPFIQQMSIKHPKLGKAESTVPDI